MDVSLQIRNLAGSVTDDDLQPLFSQAGQVLNVKIIRDTGSGMSKGYGFVTMSALSEADTAVSRLNGFALHGRALQVSLARKRTVQGRDRAPRQPRSQQG